MGPAIDRWRQPRSIFASRNVTAAVRCKGTELVEFERGPILITDAEGRFRTPKELRSDGEYAAFAETGDFQAERTPWTSVGSGSFSDLTLRRPTVIVALEGKVRDRAGQPIAGATVWNSEAPSARIKCDEQGRFPMNGLREGSAFLFVRKDGYRFGGRILEPSVRSVEFVLSRPGELPARRLETLQSPLPRADEIKLARELLERRLNRILKDSDPTAMQKLLSTMATLDPSRAWRFSTRGSSLTPMVRSWTPSDRGPPSAWRTSTRRRPNR